MGQCIYSLFINPKVKSRNHRATCPLVSEDMQKIIIAKSSWAFTLCLRRASFTVCVEDLALIICCHPSNKAGAIALLFWQSEKTLPSRSLPQCPPSICRTPRTCDSHHPNQGQVRRSTCRGRHRSPASQKYFKNTIFLICEHSKSLFFYFSLQCL